MSVVASLSTFVYAVMVLRATIGQNYTDFRFPCGPQDCADAVCWNDMREWPTLNHPISGPFFPNSKQGESKEAICDHLHAATLVVRRNRDVPSISFERTWQDYENGFGVFGNHWLGLKHIHRLSSRGKQMISLIYRTQNGNESHMLDGAWDSFTVDGANTLYMLSLGPSRKRNDVMHSAKGQPFYTRDKITNPRTLRCGLRFSGGWWFDNCSRRKSYLINLNGQFNATDADKSVFVGTHVVISAEIRMQPFLYQRDKYTCDKTCPNGGTCQQSSEKASYFCRCLPTFTGLRCESQISTANNIDSTTTPPTTTDSSKASNTKYLYIGIGLSTLICILAFIVAGETILMQIKRNRETQQHEEDEYEHERALVEQHRAQILKAKETPPLMTNTPPGQLDKATRPQKPGESVKATRLQKKVTPPRELLKATRPQKKVTPPGTPPRESVKAARLQKKTTPPGESAKATRPQKKVTPPGTPRGESFKATRPQKKTTPPGESAKATRLQKKVTPPGESAKQRRPQTKGTPTGSPKKRSRKNTE